MLKNVSLSVLLFLTGVNLGWASVTDTIEASLNASPVNATGLNDEWALLRKAYNSQQSGQVALAVEGVSDSSELVFF